LGKAGRVPPPPEGKIYVRDPAAASAQAIKDAVAVYEATGAEVPEHLAELAAGLSEEVDDVIIEVDSDFGAEPGRYTETAAEEEAEAEVEAEAEAEVEAEEEAEAEEAVEESEEAQEADLEEFTVAELKEELDALGVEYDPRARKAELIELVRQAEEA
jgi:arginyl-tRNA synthetase